MDDAKRLIERLVADPNSSESTEFAYELLTEYQRGSPVETLRILLSSSEDVLAGEGAWIASELAGDGKPLLSDLYRLLKHRSKKARFWAIDCVLLWASPTNGDLLAAAVAKVDDAEQAVRWKVMGFISMASPDQLQAALNHFKIFEPESPHVDELLWLLGSGSSPTEIMAALQDDSARHRKYAAAASFRLAKADTQSLLYAASSNDPEVAQFSMDMLKRMRYSSG